MEKNARDVIQIEMTREEAYEYFIKLIQEEPSVFRKENERRVVLLQRLWDNIHDTAKNLLLNFDKYDHIRELMYSYKIKENDEVVKPDSLKHLGSETDGKDYKERKFVDTVMFYDAKR